MNEYDYIGIVIIGVLKHHNLIKIRCVNSPRYLALPFHVISKSPLGIMFWWTFQWQIRKYLPRLGQISEHSSNFKWQSNNARIQWIWDWTMQQFARVIELLFYWVNIVNAWCQYLQSESVTFPWWICKVQEIKICFSVSMVFFNLLSVMKICFIKSDQYLSSS